MTYPVYRSRSMGQKSRPLPAAMAAALPAEATPPLPVKEEILRVATVEELKTQLLFHQRRVTFIRKELKTRNTGQ